MSSVPRVEYVPPLSSGIHIARHLCDGAGKARMTQITDPQSTIGFIIDSPDEADYCETNLYPTNDTPCKCGKYIWRRRTP